VVPKEQRLKILGNLDKDSFAAVFGPTAAASASDRCDALKVIGALAYDRIRASSPQATLPDLPFSRPRISADAAAAAAGVQVLVPKVIRYIDGVPVTEQDTLVTTSVLERFAWSEFMDTAEVANQLEDDVCRSAVLSAIANLRVALRTASAAAEGNLVHIEKGGEKKGVRVVAARSFKKGELRLAPLVPSPMRIVTACTQGWAPVVRVRGQGGQLDRQFFLTVTTSLPPSRPTVAPAAAGFHAEASLTDHVWKPSHFPWPFWAVPRQEAATGTNCTLAPFTVDVVQACNAAVLNDPIVEAYQVEVPVLVNSVDVAEGDELVAHWPARVLKTAAPAATKVKTWVDQAAKRPKKA
jgi:hypothetical protein